MISDRRRFGERSDDALVAAVGAAAAAGIDLVQIRERDLEGRALASLVTRCLDATRRTRTRVLVNDRLDVALTAGAHGVHLRGDSMPASRARALAPAGFVIGRSVHSVDEAERVTEEGGLDYLLFGSVFSTASKPGVVPAGVGVLTEVVESTTLPVLAVGGITANTAHGLAATGAAGVAAIGMFADASADMSATLARLVRVFHGGASG
jgi:thiamine-phosphate pyrophosphorylase